MPFDRSLAARVRALLSSRGRFEEKRMFGGVGFLLNGNLCVGVWKEFLIARVGPDAYQAALAEPAVREFDITGRPMTGWVMVEADALESERSLEAWIHRAMDFVERLPKK